MSRLVAGLPLYSRPRINIQQQELLMNSGMPALSHTEQQVAADRIHRLMEQGMSSGEAIAQVAAEIRANHTGAHIQVSFDDEDED
nr:YoaH family protein [Hafnia paralvei]